MSLGETSELFNHQTPNAKAETSCAYRDPVLLLQFASNVSIYRWVHQDDVRAAPKEGTPREGTQSPKKLDLGLGLALSAIFIDSSKMG